MRVAAEQPLVGDQRFLDLGVAGQRAFLGDAEALGGLALGGAEVLDAVLGHDARGLLGDGAAKVLVAEGLASWHGAPGSTIRPLRADGPAQSRTTARRSALPGCSGAALAGRQLVEEEILADGVRVARPGPAGPVCASMRAVTSPGGIGRGTSGTPRRPSRMNRTQIGTATLLPSSPSPSECFLVEAHPDRGLEVRVEAVEPGVVRFVGGAGLAADVLAPEHAGAHAGAALDHVRHDVVHEPGVGRRDDARGAPGRGEQRRQLLGRAAGRAS